MTVSASASPARALARGFLGLVVAVALLLAVVPASHAAVQKAIWGPTEFEGQSQFPIYRDLGIRLYQTGLRWNEAAPTRPANPRDPADPAYAWPASLDATIRDAARHGIGVTLQIHSTPAWANGNRAFNYPPADTRDFANFIQAAAKRYPTVRHWIIWGEPHRRVNFGVTLNPRGYSAEKKGYTPTQKRETRHYARLLDAAYTRLKRASRRNLVIGGNTTTIGDIDPYNWIRNLRLPNGKPPRMDLYGHNPFTTRTPDLSKGRIQWFAADFSDLDVVARLVDKNLRRAGTPRRKKIFISEFGAPTDAKGYEFNFFVTRAVQARWARAAFRIARDWGRIYALGWVTLRDHPPRPEDGLPSRTGLIDLEGRKKPAYYVFKRGR